MPPRLSPSAFNSLREASNSHLPRAALRSFTCCSCKAQQHNDQAISKFDGHQQTAVPQRRLPRWASTPAAMMAPVSLKKHDPKNRFNVNEDPVRLDQAYQEVFGDGGETLLTEEAKWLAVTHKSFDQGRRGYNDRLAYLGKRIVDLQTSLAILAQPDAGAPAPAPSSSHSSEDVSDRIGREPFSHPAMDILPKLTPEARKEHTNIKRLAALASEFGLNGVVRWKPRRVTDLEKSGQPFVMAQSLYAMIGAVALQKGGDVAVKAVRARILPRLGLNV